MSLKTLAEGIILQSIEDLWNENYREESITFLKGGDFRLCADLADMDLREQVELLSMVNRSVGTMEFRSRRKAGQERDVARAKRASKKQFAARY